MTREEAIEVYHGLLNQKIKEAFEVFAPELKESEDERIRKWLIEELENTRDAMSSKNPYSDDPDIVARLKRLDEGIAYLEKQKAVETPQWMIDFLNDIRTASINKEGYDDYDGRREYEGKILAIIRWLEGNFIQQKEPNNRYAGLEITNVVRQALIECEAYRNFRPDVYAARVGATVETLVQKEQKSIIKDVELNDAVYDYVRDHFIAGADFTPEYIKKLMENAFFAGVDYYLLKQKPVEWSEEDERMRIKILEALSAYADHMQYEGLCNSGLIRGELMGWLKSLPERFNLQPKQEWSEEDKAMIDDIIFSLPRMANGSIEMLPSVAKSYSERLKSLQPHWKPSEEQMKALEIIIKGFFANAFSGHILERIKTLYNDLRKNYEQDTR